MSRSGAALLLVLFSIAWLFCAVAGHYLEAGSACRDSAECGSFAYFGDLACLNHVCQGIPVNGACSPAKGGCIVPPLCTEYKDILTGESHFVCGRSSLLENGPQMPPESSNYLGVFGIFMAILGTILNSLAANLIKCSSKAQATSKKRIMVIWYTGITVYILSNACTLIALMFTTQSLIAPLGGFGLMANLVFAFWLNKETFHRFDYIGLCLCIIGSLFVIFNAETITDADLTLEELSSKLGKTSSVVFLFSLLAILAPAIVHIWYLEIRPSRSKYISILNPTTDDADVSISSKHESRTAAPLDLALSNTKIKEPLNCEDCLQLGQSLVAPCAYPLVAGSFGATMSMLVKSVIGFVHISFSGNNQFMYCGPYFIIVAILFIIFIQLWLCHQGIKKYDTSIQVPIFHTTYTIISILYGMIYFSESSQMTWGNLVLFIFGVVITCAGSFFLALRNLQIR